METGTYGTGVLRVDLNCDLGESFGAYVLGRDELVVPYVTSVNIACGLHAGDPSVMRRTVCLAAEHGVAVGAHPGYPDLQGFGRRDMALSTDEIYAYVLYQIGALGAFCSAQGVPLHHVKPHGQLYNRAVRNRPVADAIARAVADYDRNLVLVGPAGSCLTDAGGLCGLTCAGEFFADRAYHADGTLVQRSLPGAVVAEPDIVAKRAIRAVCEGVVESVEGLDVCVAADTICLHGDTAQAVELAVAVHGALERAGVEVVSFGGLR